MNCPPLPRQLQSHKDAAQALERFVYCEARRDAADHRAHCAGYSTMTGDRNHRTSLNWGEKADEALEALRAYLRRT